MKNRPGTAHPGKCKFPSLTNESPRQQLFMDFQCVCGLNQRCTLVQSTCAAPCASIGVNESRVLQTITQTPVLTFGSWKLPAKKQTFLYLFSFLQKIFFPSPFQFLVIVHVFIKSKWLRQTRPSNRRLVRATTIPPPVWRAEAHGMAMFFGLWRKKKCLFFSKLN